MTISEKRFEKFCESSEIAYKRIPTAAHKTPDYLIRHKAFEALVEVKEIRPNPEEKRIAAIPAERWGEYECTYYGGTPGERVRQKIDSAAKQLKSEPNRNIPRIIVLANLTNYPEVCDTYAISVAMFGFEEALISSEMAPEGGAKILQKWHGPNKRTTRLHNRSLSAIGIIEMSQITPSLNLYHNPFSSAQIEPNLLLIPTVTHHRIIGNPEQQFITWT